LPEVFMVKYIRINQRSKKEITKNQNSILRNPEREASLIHA